MEKLINSGLCPEEQFIIERLRSEFSQKGKDKFSTIDLNAIDWGMVYKISIDWCVTPLLYKTIKKRPSLMHISGASDHISKMRKAFLQTCFLNELSFKRLAEALEIFNKAGIDVILLKGSHLAQFIYKGIELRPMADIDILVKEKDLSKAEELLVQMGYSSIPLSQDVKKQAYLKERAKIYHHHLHPLIHLQKEGANILEIHWTIAKPSSPFSIDIDGLWKRAETVSMNEIETLVFSLEDLLLHLSLHTSYHDRFMNCGLTTLCDIATVINNYGQKIDWEQLIERAYEWKAERCLYLTLYLAQEILGFFMPYKILDVLGPDMFNKTIISEAQRRIFSPEATGSVSANTAHLAKFHPDSSLLEKISFIFQRIFIPSEELIALYSLPRSSKWVYFYYPVHFFSFMYRFIPVYAPFFFYLFTHKKADLCQNDLDLWIISQDSKKPTEKQKK